MGLLVNGHRRDRWYDTKSTGGRFVRNGSDFRNRITADGSSGFKAESGRYHLYVSYACPWAHRTLIYRRLKGLTDHISISVVNPLMLEHGWTFEPGDGVIPDPINKHRGRDRRSCHQPPGNTEQYLAGDRCALDLDRQGGDGAHRYCQCGQPPRPSFAKARRHQVRNRQTVVALDERNHPLAHSPALEGAGEWRREDDPQAGGAGHRKVTRPANEYEG